MTTFMCMCRCLFDICRSQVEEEEDIFEGKPYILLYMYKWVKREMGTGKDATAGFWRSLLEGGPFLQAGTPPRCAH